MINSKILKRKFTVDTSLNHLYQMNQKACKKSLSIISSKDDATTASLLGFAIANRVEPHSATLAASDAKERYSKGDHNYEGKEAKSKHDKEQ